MPVENKGIGWKRFALVWKNIAAVYLIFLALHWAIVPAQAGSNAWVWVKGANDVDQFGVYGTLGVPDPANTPGARYGAALWRGVDGSIWLFGGNGVAASGANGYLNDLWKFDPAAICWTWVKGANSVDQFGVYGRRGVADPANTPGGRYGAVLWKAADGSIWLFGGNGVAASGARGYLNDLWKFDPITANWTWIKGANVVDQFGLYGTQGVADPANTPGGRYGAAAWTDADGAMWLFGGNGVAASGANGYLNDLWKFDPLTADWTRTTIRGRKAK